MGYSDLTLNTARFKECLLRTCLETYKFYFKDFFLIGGLVACILSSNIKINNLLQNTCCGKFYKTVVVKKCGYSYLHFWNFKVCRKALKVKG